MKFMRSRPRSIPPKQTPKHTSEAYPLDKPSSGDTVFPDGPIYIYIEYMACPSIISITLYTISILNPRHIPDLSSGPLDRSSGGSKFREQVELAMQDAKETAWSEKNMVGQNLRSGFCRKKHWCKLEVLVQSSKPGWWFGTCLFFHILGIIIPND